MVIMWEYFNPVKIPLHLALGPIYSNLQNIVVVSAGSVIFYSSQLKVPTHNYLLVQWIVQPVHVSCMFVTLS